MPHGGASERVQTDQRVEQEKNNRSQILKCIFIGSVKAQIAF